MGLSALTSLESWLVASWLRDSCCLPDIASMSKWGVDRVVPNQGSLSSEKHVFPQGSPYVPLAPAVTALPVVSRAGEAGGRWPRSLSEAGKAGLRPGE